MTLPSGATVLAQLAVAIVTHEMFHAWVAVSLGITLGMAFVGFPIKPYLTFRVANIPVRLSPWLLIVGVAIDARSFWRAPFWKKTLVLVYGPLGSLISSILAAVLIYGPSRGLLLVQELTSQVMGILLHGNGSFVDLSGRIGAATLAKLTTSNDQVMGLLFVWVILNVGIALVNFVPLPGFDTGNIVLGAYCSLTGNTDAGAKVAQFISLAFTFLLSGVAGFLLLRGVFFSFF